MASYENVDTYFIWEILFPELFLFSLEGKINNFPVIIFTSKLPGYSVLHYIAHRHAEKCLGESAYVF